MDSTEIITDKHAQIDKLKQDVGIVRSKKKFYDNLRKTVPITGITIFFASLIAYILLHKSFVLIIGVFYLIIAIIYPIANPGKSIGLEIDALESEISLRSTESNLVEERAERLFKSHEIDLKKYYNLGLNQNNTIFIVGIICMLLGLIIIGSTIYLIYSSKAQVDIRLKIIIASLGALSGILTNFIAVVYLKMFSQTVNSFTTFHNKLVSTNHLHFVNFLLSKIDDKTTKDDTIKSICNKISENIK